MINLSHRNYFQSAEVESYHDSSCTRKVVVVVCATMLEITLERKTKLGSKLGADGWNLTIEKGILAASLPITHIIKNYSRFELTTAKLTVSLSRMSSSRTEVSKALSNGEPLSEKWVK